MIEFTKLKYFLILKFSFTTFALKISFAFTFLADNFENFVVSTKEIMAEGFAIENFEYFVIRNSKVLCLILNSEAMVIENSEILVIKNSKVLMIVNSEVLAIGNSS